METRRKLLHSETLEASGKQEGFVDRRPLKRQVTAATWNIYRIFNTLKEEPKRDKHERGRPYGERLRDLFLLRQRWN